MNNNSKFKGTYCVPSSRLIGYDYGQNGAYFITICTKDKIDYFGNFPHVGSDEIPQMNQTPIGKCPSILVRYSKIIFICSFG